VKEMERRDGGGERKSLLIDRVATGPSKSLN